MDNVTNADTACRRPPTWGDLELAALVAVECARLDAAAQATQRRALSHHAYRTGAKQRAPLSDFAADRRAHRTAQLLGLTQ